MPSTDHTPSGSKQPRKVSKKRSKAETPGELIDLTQDTEVILGSRTIRVSKSTQLAVLLVLTRYRGWDRQRINRKTGRRSPGPSGLCAINKTKLSEETGLDRKTVQAALKALISLGVIQEDQQGWMLQDEETLFQQAGGITASPEVDQDVDQVIDDLLGNDSPVLAGEGGESFPTSNPRVGNDSPPLHTNHSLPSSSLRSSSSLECAGSFSSSLRSSSTVPAAAANRRFAAPAAAAADAVSWSTFSFENEEETKTPYEITEDRERRIKKALGPQWGPNTYRVTPMENIGGVLIETKLWVTPEEKGKAHPIKVALELIEEGEGFRGGYVRFLGSKEDQPTWWDWGFICQEAKKVSDHKKEPVSPWDYLFALEAKLFAFKTRITNPTGWAVRVVTEDLKAGSIEVPWSIRPGNPDSKPKEGRNPPASKKTKKPASKPVSERTLSDAPVRSGVSQAYEREAQRLAEERAAARWSIEGAPMGGALGGATVDLHEAWS